MTNISGRFYRAADYFKDDLPIVVQHNIHSPADFDPPESLNRRQFWKILYIIDGTGLLKINHREYPFGPGFVCLNHPDDLTNLALDRPVELCNILFLQKTIENDLARLYNDNSFFSIFRPDFRPEQSLSHNLLHLIDSNRRIYLEIRRLHHEYTHTDANSGEMLRHMLVGLLIEFSRQSARVFNRKRRQNAAGHIDRFLRENFAQPFDRERAAREVGMSKGYLFSYYRAATGRTIGETLLAIRLEEAKKLLAGTGMKIETVCYRCGFSDLSNFYKLFRRAAGTTPGAFRKSARRQPPAARSAVFPAEISRNQPGDRIDHKKTRDRADHDVPEERDVPEMPLGVAGENADQHHAENRDPGHDRKVAGLVPARVFGESDHDEQNRRIAESVPELFDRDAAADGPE